MQAYWASSSGELPSRLEREKVVNICDVCVEVGYLLITYGI